MRLCDQLKTLLNDVKFEDGWLTGRIVGDVCAGDTTRLPYTLHAI